MRIFFIIILLLINYSFAQQGFNETSVAPGTFSRMGFGPRGISLGNAAGAINKGNVNSYYNPALSVFQNDNSFSSAYSFLGLDRSLNFVNFTRRFEFFSDKDSLVVPKKPRSTAGVSLGLINAGVSKIDGRDNQGFKKGDLSTSENQFFMAFANKFSEKLAVGLGIKFYYYKLYEDITSTGLGFDVGAIYMFNPQLVVGFTISDLNAKYKWDTSPLFGTDGSTSENKFPTTKKISVSYYLDDPDIILAAEYEFNNMHNRLFRFGTEYKIFEYLQLRGGIDNVNITTTDSPIRPSLGFGYIHQFGKISVVFDYAFAYEPYSPSSQHIVGLNIIF
jgi:hypothetical protein